MRQIDGYPLWIGTARDARDLKGLHAVGIEAVVDLAAEEPPAVLSRDLVYQRFPLLDGDGNPPWLLRAAVNAVAELVGGTAWAVVACSGGMSRSPAVAAYGIAEKEHRSAERLLAGWKGDGPLDVSPALCRSLRGEPPKGVRIDREEAVSLAVRFLDAGGRYKVVRRVSDEPWAGDEPTVCEFDRCFFIDQRPRCWSVTFRSQLAPGVSCVEPAGPVVLVNANSGVASHFAAL